MEDNKQPGTNSYKYHAFISYRHADNKAQGRQWATWLHQAIETFEVPKDLVGKKNGRGDVIPSRIYPIFRDEEELPAHADLGTSIVGALEQTNLLVVLCSPRAVASTYVADEIDYFKKLGGADRIIAAMIDGEPNTSWDESKHSLGFSKEDECFPIPLQFEYDQNGNPTGKHAEPIAADFRINNDGKAEEGWTTPAAYREHLKASAQLDNKAIDKKVDTYQQQLHLMLLKIIAGILGVPLGELTQRDKEYQLEQERLKAKKLRQWLAALFVLAILAVGAGIFAYLQKEEAQFQTILAKEAEKIAKAKEKQANESLIQANHNLGLTFTEKAGSSADKKELSFEFIYRLYAQKYLKPQSKEFRLNKLTLNMNEFKNPISTAEVVLNEDVNAVVLSNEGDRLLSGLADGSLNLWNTKTGDLERSFTGHSSSVLSVAFSPDSKMIASASNDKKIQLWDADTGRRIHTYVGHTGAVNSVAFSPDGRMLVSASSDNTLILWHVKTNQKIHTLIGHKGSVNDAVFSSNGQYIASASDDKTLQLWDPTTGQLKSTFAESLPGAEEKHFVLSMNSKQTIKVHFDSVTSVAISPDSSLIASASKDETIKLWDARTGKLVKNFVGHSGDVNSLAFNSSGDTLVSGSDDKAIMMWDVYGTNGKGIKGILKGHSEKINSVFYSVNNQTIVSGSNDNTVKVWDITDTTSFNYNLLCEEQDGSEFEILDINPDHTEAIGLCMDGWLYFVDLKSGQIKRQFLSENIEKAIYNPDGRTVFFVLNRGGILFDIKTASLKKLIKLEKGIYSIAFHPDGRHIVTGHKTGYIKYWNTVTGELFRSQKVSKKSVESIKFSSDADKIAVTTTNRVNDSLLVIFDANLNKVIQTYEFNGGNVDFSPDSKFIAFASPNNIINLRDVVSGKLAHQFNENLTSLSYVSSIGFSLDGKTLASSSYGGGFSLWSISTGQKIYSKVNDYFDEITFSTDQESLVAYDSESGLLKRWQLTGYIPLSSKEELNLAITHLESSQNYLINGTKVELANKPNAPKESSSASKKLSVMWPTNNVINLNMRAKDGDNRAIAQLGEIAYLAGDFQHAKAFFSDSLRLGNRDAEQRLRAVQRSIDNGPFPTEEEAQYNIDTKIHYNLAAKYERLAIDILEASVNKNNIALIESYSNNYLAWSWYKLHTDKFSEIPNKLIPILKKLPEGDKKVELHTNLAHAYLLLSYPDNTSSNKNYLSAKAIYEKYKGYKFQGGYTWDKVIINDFKVLSKNDITNADFARIAKEVFGEVIK